jgi:ectoine hydroxylase-related dioxygenase (phytanoyl-CoA dioxygenase family)
MLERGPEPGDLAAALERFREDGYARLGRVVDEPALARLRARADDIMLGREAPGRFFFQHDASSGRYEDLEFGKGYVGPSLAYRKIEKLERDALFWKLIHHPAFERVARALIAGEIAIYRAVLFNKAPRAGTVLPWHQDGGSYWGLDRAPFVQIWLALDDAPEEAGCLEVLPGSHRGGLATPLGGMIPEARVAAAGARERSVRVPARAGEALLVHNLLWHGSGTNRTDAPRRGVTVCYMSADTRCVRKRKAPRGFVRVFEGRPPPTAPGGNGSV